MVVFISFKLTLTSNFSDKAVVHISGGKYLEVADGSRLLEYSLTELNTIQEETNDALREEIPGLRHTEPGLLTCDRWVSSELKADDTLKSFFW